MKIRFLFAWYDFWVGAYWDSHKRRLYVLPVPCLGIVLDFDPLPKLNARRLVLLDKKYHQGGLTESESAELTDLNNEFFKILDARYSRSPDLLEAQIKRLDDIETRIKNSRETTQQETDPC